MVLLRSRVSYSAGDEIFNSCKDLDAPFTRNPHVLLTRVGPGAASLSFERALPTAAAARPLCLRPCLVLCVHVWLTRSCFNLPAVALAPSDGDDDGGDKPDAELLANYGYCNELEPAVWQKRIAAVVSP